MKLKAAREAKGLSQQALAKIAGVPQSHISKIENAGVDLRVSSLTEISRALDLELALVPREAVPAIKSIVRSTEPVAAQKSGSALARELNKLESFGDKIAQQQNALKEASQLQSRIHDITRFKVPDSYLGPIKKLNKQLKAIYEEPESIRLLGNSLDQIQKLRNTLAHGASKQLQHIRSSVYSLEDADDG